MRLEHSPWAQRAAKSCRQTYETIHILSHSQTGSSLTLYLVQCIFISIFLRNHFQQWSQLLESLFVPN